MIKYDIVIITVPFLQNSPQTGPAILKAVLQKEGFSCKVIDWNFDLIRRCNKGKTGRRIYGDYDSNMKKFYKKNFDNILQEWINDIKKLNPRWIGLSIFSFRTAEPIINKICEQIRLHLPNIKIVAGGHGVSMTVKPLGEELLRKKMIDCYISGDGEEAIISLLKNEKEIPGLNDVNNPTQLLNLSGMPLPDYTDTPPNLYSDETFIISSRGCINNCVFCSGYYKRFVIRDPKDVVDEIIELNKKYDCKKFQFADSLTNGNAKHILKISNLIVDYNNKNILPKIRWSCDWVCRSKKLINKNIYKAISESGCFALLVGIESGSEKVRRDMRKPIKDEDIFFLLEQCKKQNVFANFLIIIGYATETEEDFQQTLDLMKKTSLYKNVKFNIGRPYMISSNTEHQIRFDKHQNWYTKNNDFALRCSRWIRTVKYCKELNIPIQYFYLDFLLENLNKYEKTPYINNIINMFEEMKNI